MGLSIYFSTLFLETLLYGIYTTLFFFTLYVLWKRPKDKSRVGLIASTVVMFAVATTHVALTLATERHEILAEMEDLQTFNAVRVFRTCIPGINFIFGDGIVAWRAWVIWGHSRRILVLPVILIFATGGTVVAEFILTTMYARAGNIDIGALAILLQIVTVVLSLGTNVLITCTIAYRAWTHSREVALLRPVRVGSDRAIHVLILLVESGALYCAIWIIYLVLIFTGGYSAAGTEIFLLVEASVTQMTGIYPTLIIVICALQRSYCDTVVTSRLSAMPSINSPLYCAPRPPSKYRPRYSAPPSPEDPPYPRGYSPEFSKAGREPSILAEDTDLDSLDSRIDADVSGRFVENWGHEK
ncbi:hypothetical protein FA95DRAFT_656334 [Auriscalpium vulgare]|uniref:Uncharacterized protein n=1 Tax=Auriscalpium vulgare TaxID=40419 RepID=A0ACB8RCC5_9AGAM|nr:hypothetical protein FA95DRAFT_656334 [Auriscalpium vulgare]